MSGPFEKRLRARRFLLENPYAHIEQVEELRIARLRENQHLYADQRVNDTERAAMPHKSHRVGAIEQAVTKLQREIWNKRQELGLPVDAGAIDVLEARYAARVLNYAYTERSSLGWITDGRDPIVVAGLIDNSKRIVEVAADVGRRVARFTSAHEIGHAVLHPQLKELHRDRPLAGPAPHRNRIEFEADKFAVFFVMPRKLVTQQFLLRFLKTFDLDEETAYALLGKPSWFVRELLPTRRHISRTLASATQFNGCNFVSLSEYFGVSVETMAIRLEELHLIEN